MGRKVFLKISKITILILSFINLSFAFPAFQYATFTCIPDPGGDYYCDQNISVCSTVPGHFTGRCTPGARCNAASTAFTPCPGSSNGGPLPTVDCSTHNPCGDDVCGATLACMTRVFPNVITAAFALIGSIAVIMLILAGIRFLTSGGEKTNIEAARKTVTYVVIGLVLIFGAYLIINIISFITGVHCISVLGFNSCK